MRKKESRQYQFMNNLTFSLKDKTGRIQIKLQNTVNPPLELISWEEPAALG